MGRSQKSSQTKVYKEATHDEAFDEESDNDDDEKIPEEKIHKKVQENSHGNMGRTWQWRKSW